jgi:general secretion pathway protein K
LAEPWAIPLQEARLSTFLSGNAEDNLAQQVFLSGQIKDLQARLNVANLLQGDQIDSPTWQAFARLFDVLGLPPTQLARLTQGLLAAQQSKEGTSTPMPQRVSQLAWLGVTPATLQTLAPYITLLPVRTPVNLNTASPLVLYASVPGLSLSDAQRLSEQRNQNPWSSLNAFQTAADHPISLEGTHSVYTRFFEVTGRLRMPATTLEERSVVQRDPTDVKVLWRETGSLQ